MAATEFNLFRSGEGARDQNRATSAVTFRAGRMTFADGTVTADPRKGTIKVSRESDGVVHFKWHPRDSTAVEHDFFILPDDAVFKRVPKCVDGRVYMLHLQSSHARHFFWMQEPKEERDDEYCKSVNDLMNQHTPAVGGAGGVDRAALRQLLGPAADSMTPQQMAALLQMAGDGQGGLDVNALAALAGGAASRGGGGSGGGRGGSGGGSIMPGFAGAGGAVDPAAELMADEDAMLQAAIAASLAQSTEAAAPAPAPAPAPSPAAGQPAPAPGQPAAAPGGNAPAPGGNGQGNGQPPRRQNPDGSDAPDDSNDNEEGDDDDLYGP